ncbi:conserved hypothetical pox protein [Squirrelpox virus]|uniref:Conserved hypothetical pox protein n=1 Tax=Squirrelpox virus TaxID=240426 RepID=U3UBA8_9POXV|nr:conserved hypothetical pox protein [Squirrelpox virus]CCD83287.1 conserved hypothetical pox protein [Squirrelpox virus]
MRADVDAVVVRRDATGPTPRSVAGRRVQHATYGGGFRTDVPRVVLVDPSLDELIRACVFLTRARYAGRVQILATREHLPPPFRIVNDL